MQVAGDGFWYEAGFDAASCTVHSRVPNDYFSLHRAVTLGQPVDGHCELGKAIENLADRLSGNGVSERKRPPVVADSRTVLSTV